VLKVGDIVLDRESHRVYRKKSEIRLGPTEFRLLEFMMRHPGRVFSRGQLLDNVWGATIYIDERTPEEDDFSFDPEDLLAEEEEEESLLEDEMLKSLQEELEEAKYL
jgi:hypothetical protein